MREWVLGLSAWVIQDGNYGDFERGQRAELAVEMYSGSGLKLVEDSPPGAVHLEDSRYEVTARVLTVADEGWAIDFGIGAYSSYEAPTGMHVGDTVHGVVALGVDPFMYFESLARIDAFPPLVYTWEIAAIRMQTAPWIEVGPRTFDRDPERLAWAEIERTDAWSDDDSHGDYLLECRRQPVEPKRRSATAI